MIVTHPASVARRTKEVLCLLNGVGAHKIAETGIVCTRISVLLGEVVQRVQIPAKIADWIAASFGHEKSGVWKSELATIKAELRFGATSRRSSRTIMRERRRMAGCLGRVSQLGDPLCLKSSRFQVYTCTLFQPHRKVTASRKNSGRPITGRGNKSKTGGCGSGALGIDRHRQQFAPGRSSTKWLLANAWPAPDFKYFSKRRAIRSLQNSMVISVPHGFHRVVDRFCPALCAFSRAATSAVTPM